MQIYGIFKAALDNNIKLEGQGGSVMRATSFVTHVSS